jgi:hypothetical protein
MLSIHSNIHKEQAGNKIWIPSTGLFSHLLAHLPTNWPHSLPSSPSPTAHGSQQGAPGCSLRCLGMQAPGIHFQHPDQPPCAATLPQTHPLKTRIATRLHALHCMRDWQVNPFYRGFRHLSFPFLVSWDSYSHPKPVGRARTGAAGGPWFQSP